MNTPQPPLKPKSRVPRPAIAVLVLVVLATAIYLLFIRSTGESSDDAFIDGHAVTIASKVAGSAITISLSILRFSSIPASMAAGMKRL